MSAASELPPEREVQETRNELDRWLNNLDSGLSALRAEIAKVQRIIDERKP